MFKYSQELILFASDSNDFKSATIPTQNLPVRGQTVQLHEEASLCQYANSYTIFGTAVLNH